MTTSVQPFSDSDLRAFERDAKIGLLATVDAEGLPHITLITSMQGKDRHRLMFGQFTEGFSKQHLKSNPHASFAIMSQDKEVWRGKARWTDAVSSGEDFELYNHKPMFRYNAYFGIHTVHYLDVVEFCGKERLAPASIAAGLLVTRVCKPFVTVDAGERVLTPWAEGHICRLGTLKFLAYVGDDGYPVIVPVVPCQAVGGRQVAFATTVYGQELDAIERGQTLALFAINLEMESVLVRGPFAGYRRYAGLRAGAMEIDWVYNSMPPKQGPIYPPEPLRAVAGF